MCNDTLCGGSHRAALYGSPSLHYLINSSIRCTPCDKVSEYCLVTDSYVDGSFVAGTVSQDQVRLELHFG